MRQIVGGRSYVNEWPDPKPPTVFQQWRVLPIDMQNIFSVQEIDEVTSCHKFKKQRNLMTKSKYCFIEKYTH